MKIKVVEFFFNKRKSQNPDLTIRFFSTNRNLKIETPKVNREYPDTQRKTIMIENNFSPPIKHV